MRTPYLAWIGAALLLLPDAAQARLIGYIPTSDQLNAQATLICNGRVLSTACMGPNLISIYSGGSPAGYPETWMSARVKVLHVFKGSASKEIVVRYRISQPHVPMKDGPQHMRLAQGDRYCFFLKPTARKDEFVNGLDGRIDDGYALQTLCEDETDDSPPMSNKEAIRIALSYLHEKESGVLFDPKLIYVFTEPGGMSVQVAVATSNNVGAERATVTVFRDRTVDEKGSQLNQRR